MLRSLSRDRISGERVKPGQRLSNKCHVRVNVPLIWSRRPAISWLRFGMLVIFAGARVDFDASRGQEMICEALQGRWPISSETAEIEEVDIGLIYYFIGVCVCSNMFVAFALRLSDRKSSTRAVDHSMFDHVILWQRFRARPSYFSPWETRHQRVCRKLANYCDASFFFPIHPR